jgi:L-lactate dehydrogenase complex protein LldG
MSGPKSGARGQILGAIRAGLGRGVLDEAAAAALEARLASPAANMVPARAQIPPEARVDLFVAMAGEADASVRRVDRAEDVPAALADYLASENLPAELAMAPDPSLDRVPWAERPLLKIRRGNAGADDLVGVTGAFAAIAETGTLMLVSGPERPTSLNLLPDTHVAIVWADQVVATYEDGWTMLRKRNEQPGPGPDPGPGGQGGGWDMPRTVGYVTGPSRSADIEQTLQLGAHGPRRVHIIVIDDQPAPISGA